MRMFFACAAMLLSTMSATAAGSVYPTERRDSIRAAGSGGTTSYGCWADRCIGGFGLDLGGIAGRFTYAVHETRRRDAQSFGEPNDVFDAHVAESTLGVAEVRTVHV